MPLRLVSRPPRLPLPLSSPYPSQLRPLARPISTAPPPPSAPQSQSRTAYDLALIGGGGAALVGLLLWAKSNKDSKAGMDEHEGSRSSFTVPVLSQ